MRRFFAVFMFGLAGSVQSQTLYDSFDSSLVTYSNFNVVTPFYDSTTTVLNGALNLKDRGSVFTSSEFLSPYEVSGTFINNNPKSVFVVTLRTDGSIAPDDLIYTKLYRQFQGVQVAFWADQAWPDNMIAINTSDVNRPNWYTTSYPLASSSEINFKIRDDGAKIWIEVNNNFITEFATSYSFGKKIGLASRENSRINLWGSGDVSVLEFNVVPEPSSLSLLLAGGLVLMAGRRRKF